jgi:hypothetical protein
MAASGEAALEKFENIGLTGQSVGSLLLHEKSVEWRDRTGGLQKVVQVSATRGRDGHVKACSGVEGGGVWEEGALKRGRGVS